MKEGVSRDPREIKQPIQMKDVHALAVTVTQRRSDVRGTELEKSQKRIDEKFNELVNQICNDAGLDAQPDSANISDLSDMLVLSPKAEYLYYDVRHELYLASSTNPGGPLT